MSAPIDLHWVQQPGSRITAVVRPTNLHEALELLDHDPALRPVAGGTDLMLELARHGNGPDVALLDLTAIAGFAALSTTRDEVVLGGGTTHNDVIAAPVIAAELLPLAQACLEIGSPQLRNRATVAGNLITASPANDTISALIALGATVVLSRLEAGSIAERTVAIEDFFTGFRSTVRRPNELLTAIRIPRPADSRRGVWVKLGLRRAQAISVVHAGLVVDIGADGLVTDARIALGSVGPTVALSAGASTALVGSALSNDSIRRAAEAAADGVTPIDDGRATAAYRRDAVATVVARGLTALADRREREMWPRRVPLLVRPDRPRSAVSRATGHAAGRVDANAEISVVVNGAAVRSGVAATASLLEWLREAAGTGTKEGCAEGECGACTVHLDGEAVMSCLVPAAQADGAHVTTIEGIRTSAGATRMQQAFVDSFAVQCGYCIPGFVMAAEALAAEVDNPTRAEIELALAGNLCRCTGYYSIIDAVHAATRSSQANPPDPATASEAPGPSAPTERSSPADTADTENPEALQ